MRVFAALGFPAPVRARLLALQRGIPGARWVRGDDLHLTLGFFGELDGSAVRDLDEALASLRAEPFSMDIQGVGYFGELRKARTLWAGVVRSDPLARLRASVQRCAEIAGIRVERRRFRPHVTLARLRGETGHHLANFLAEHSLLCIPGIPVEEVALYESITGGEGSVYRPVCVYPLSSELAPPVPADAASASPIRP